MLVPVQISAEERQLLVDYHRGGSCALLRDRALTILLNSDGHSACKIATTLDRQPDTIRSWLKAYQVSRISSLFSRYVGNSNSSKLTSSQKKQVAETLSKPPSEFGIPKEFWQVKDLKRWIKLEFGVMYESDRSYHFLFNLSRFSWKLPDKFDINRNDQLVKQRIIEIREKIEPLLNSPEWEVLASDETRMVWEAESRRAWLRTNQKTIIKVNRSQDYQSFLGSLNLKTGKCHLHTLKWQNQVEIIQALKKLKTQYPNKRICLIWDNARWHKGKMIRAELSKNGSLSSFHLINFPPYAPDTNPQEHVWKYAKDRIAHQPTSNFKQKINNFKLAVIHRKFEYKV